MKDRQRREKGGSPQSATFAHFVTASVIYNLQSNSLTVIVTMSSNLSSVPLYQCTKVNIQGPRNWGQGRPSLDLTALDTTSIAAQDRGKTHDLFKMWTFKITFHCFNVNQSIQTFFLKSEDSLKHLHNHNTPCRTSCILKGSIFFFF